MIVRVQAVDRFSAPLEPHRSVEESSAASEGQLPLFDELPPAHHWVGIELPTLAEIQAPPQHDVRRLSYSALALYERCAYRYFAERVLGLAPAGRGDAGGDGVPELAATEIGEAVHRLLEGVPLDDPAAPPRPELEALVRGWYPAASDSELARIAGLVDAYCASEFAARIAQLQGARPERPFAFEHDGVLLHGRLDVLGANE